MAAPHPTKEQAAFEDRIVPARVAQVEANPIQGNFDASHLKAIHQAVGQDVERVRPGQFRADAGSHFKTRASGTSAYSVPYDDAKDIASNLDKVLPGRSLVTELKGLSDDQFAQRMSGLYAAVDKIHPFEDYNSRTLRLFTSQLAKEAGRDLDYSRIAYREFGVADFNRARDVAVFEATFPQLDFSKPIKDSQLFEIRQTLGDDVSNSALWGERIVGAAKSDPNFKDLTSLVREASNIRTIEKVPEPVRSRVDNAVRDLSPNLAIGLEKGTAVSPDTQAFLNHRDTGRGKESEVLKAAYQAEKVMRQEVTALGPVAGVVAGRMNKLIQEHIAYQIESGGNPKPEKDILTSVRLEAAQQQLRHVADLGPGKREHLADVSPERPGEFSISREQSQWLTAEAERTIEIGRAKDDLLRIRAAENIAKDFAQVDMPQQRDRFKDQELRNEYRLTQDELQDRNRQLRDDMQRQVREQDLER